MITSKQIQEALERARACKGPILSAYVRMNPNEPASSVATRVRSTLGELDVPAELQKKIAGEIGDLEQRPRTFVVFEGEAVSERIELDAALPVTDRTTGRFEASYGDEPYVAPLLMALDHHERLGIVYVDRENLRIFETFLGATEEVYDARTQLEPYQPDVASSAKQIHPNYMAMRDDAHEDRKQDHERTTRDRFYRSQLIPLRTFVNERDIDRLILVGPERELAAFERQLPARIAARIAARSNAIPDSALSASQMYDHVSDLIRTLDAKRQKSMIEAIDGQAGVRGTDQALTELQRGRIEKLIVPWKPGSAVEVYRATDSGWVGATKKAAEEHLLNGGAVEPIDLMDVLPNLAESFGASLEFVSGDASEELDGEIAGLRRW